MQDTTVAIIIVNYKTGHLVAESLQRLSQTQIHGLHLAVYVVDNASPDDSLAVIDESIRQLQAQAWAHLIAHPHNGGFAAGNNVGFKAATEGTKQPDYFFLLNPDACVQPDTLSNLLAFASQQTTPAILGCQLLDEHLTARPSAFRFPGALSEFQRGASLGLIDRLCPSSRVSMPVTSVAHEADWVSGAAFLVPRMILDTVGPMDEGYFLYYEEVDFMRKAKNAGFKIWSVPQSRVIHLAGASTGIVTGKTKAKKMPHYWYQSWRRYFIGAKGLAGAWACGLLWLLGRTINQMLALVVPRRRDSGGHHVSDFVRYALLNQEPRS